MQIKQPLQNPMSKNNYTRAVLRVVIDAASLCSSNLPGKGQGSAFVAGVRGFDSCPLIPTPHPSCFRERSSFPAVQVTRHFERRFGIQEIYRTFRYLASPVLSMTFQGFFAPQFLSDCWLVFIIGSADNPARLQFFAISKAYRRRTDRNTSTLVSLLGLFASI